MPRGRPKLSEEEKEQRKSERREEHKNIVSGGHEPKWDGICIRGLRSIAVGAAFNYYALHSTDTQQRRWFLEILEKHHFNQKNLEALKLLPEKVFAPYGGLARMFLLGARLPKVYQDKIVNFAKKLLPEALKLTEKEVKKRGRKVKSEEPVHVHIIDPKYVEMATRIDGLLDQHMLERGKDLLTFNLNDFLKANTISAENIHQLKYHLKNLNVDMEKYLDKDEETLEAYPFLSRPIAKHVAEFIKNLNATAENFTPAIPGKKQRKPRRKKVKTPEEILKFFKFMPEEKSLKIHSIDPENILGASQLWIFNTKYRKLGVFNAKTDAGFEVRRTMIENYDPETSISKTLRKPQDVLPKLLGAGKVELRKMLPGIKAKEQKLKSRINEDILLVRVIK